MVMKVWQYSGSVVCKGRQCRRKLAMKEIVEIVIEEMSSICVELGRVVCAPVESAVT